MREKHNQRQRESERQRDRHTVKDRQIERERKRENAMCSCLKLLKSRVSSIVIVYFEFSSKLTSESLRT